jgi:hypothetical protein
MEFSNHQAQIFVQVRQRVAEDMLIVARAPSLRMIFRLSSEDRIPMLRPVVEVHL